MAAWNIEYRRVGSGGGWPTTFTDVAAAIDLLPEAVQKAAAGRLDLDRVVFLGHSAGGHLATWAASRDRLRDAYLQPWRELLPEIDLVAVFELAQTIAGLHYASNYHCSILRISTEHGARELLPFFLRTLLDEA